MDHAIGAIKRMSLIRIIGIVAIVKAYMTYV